MEDWKGNKIQPGHTVVTIATRSEFEGTTLGIAKWNGVMWELVHESEPIKKSYLFDIVSKYTITEPSNNVVIRFNNKPSLIPINHIDFYILKHPHQIICIEGVSDNKEEYYMDYFNT